MSSPSILLIYQKLEKKRWNRRQERILFTDGTIRASSFRPYTSTPSICCPAWLYLQNMSGSFPRQSEQSRNRLLEKAIKACECLKTEWRQGVVTDADTGTKRKKRKSSEVEKEAGEVED
jgi:hypothetical protein